MTDVPKIIVTDEIQLGVADGPDVDDLPDISTTWPPRGARVRFRPRARKLVFRDTGKHHFIDDVLGYYDAAGVLRRGSTRADDGTVTAAGAAGVPLTDMTSDIWVAAVNPNESSWDVVFEGFDFTNAGVAYVPDAGHIAPGYPVTDGVPETRLGFLLPYDVVNGVPVVKGDPGVSFVDARNEGVEQVVFIREDGQESNPVELPPGPQGNPGFNALGAEQSAATVGQYLDQATEAQRAMHRNALAVLTPEAFGWMPVEDGGAPVTQTQLNNLLAAVVAKKGARIQGGFGKTYRCDLQINIPNDGATPPRNYPVVWAGMGMNASGQGTAPLGGTVWDLRYAGSQRASGTNPDGTTVNLNDAKIVTVGLGVLWFEHCALTDLGTSSAPFVHGTYTTIRTVGLGVFGNPSKARTTCDQDVFVLGGQTIIPGTPASSDPDAPFQGYGTRIEGVFVNRVRRLVLGQIYCNAIVVRDNTVWAQSGSNLPLGAAIEFRGDPTTTCSGNIVSGNLIEMVGYPVGIALYSTVHTAVVNNPLFDGIANLRKAGVYCGPGAQYNLIEQGFAEDNYPALLEDPTVAYSNTFRTTHQAQISVQPQPVRHYNSLRVIRDGGNAGVGIEGRGNQSAVRAQPGTHPYPTVNIRSAPSVQVTDGVTTAGSRVVTSATAGFAARHRGMPIFSSGNIPANAVIVSVDSATQVTISAAATTTSTGAMLNFGDFDAAFTDEIGFARRHFLTVGSAPTVAVTGNAGSGATSAMTSSTTNTDSAFSVTITLGTAPNAGSLFTVTPNIAYTGKTKVSVTPKSAGAAAVMANGYHVTTTAQGVLSFLALVAPPASAVLEFDVLTMQ